MKNKTGHPSSRRQSVVSNWKSLPDAVVTAPTVTVFQVPAAKLMPIQWPGMGVCVCAERGCGGGGATTFKS